MQTAEGSRKAVVQRRTGWVWFKGQLYRRATIDVLPDDVLLGIFKFYLDKVQLGLQAWHKLVHVCRRWRQVVFASPRHLNLRLLWTYNRPVKKLLDIWPALPIVIYDYHGSGTWLSDIDAVQEHHDRVCRIIVKNLSSPLLDSMTEPFPALTDLELESEYEEVLPDSFLGGSAPRLRNLELKGIPLPGLPKLLLSAHHLVLLFLLDIPDSGYISPEEMVTCLSSLTSLAELLLEFQPSQPCPDRGNRRWPRLIRTALPSLTCLAFFGVSEYLEDIVARIDTPLLNFIIITFFDQPIFDTPLLRSFFSRTEAFKAFHRAEILFSDEYFQVTLLREGQARDGVLRLAIVCQPSGRLLSSMVQLCKSTLPPLPTLEHLYISASELVHCWQDDMQDAQWLELLHSFITVKNLYLDILSRVAPFLQVLAREDSLPALQNVFVEGPVPQAIAQFIATQQLLGHPVAVQYWNGTLPEVWWDSLAKEGDDGDNDDDDDDDVDYW